MSAVRWILTGLALAALCAPLTVAAAALSGIGHRWVDILAQFTAPVLAATAALAVVLVIARLWLAGGAAGLVALVLLAAVWPQWATPRGRPRPDIPPVSLYSANLWFRNTDVEAIKASIDAADADIVVLIELGETPDRSLDRLLAAYPHRHTVPTMDRPSPNRTVIASRFPLMPIPGARDGLQDIAATVRTPFGPLNVVGVHLTRPWPYQYQWGQITQTMALRDLVAGLKGPVVVAGDFNSVSDARIGRMVKTDIGLLPAPGWPGTWPSALPSAVGITIDQVYRSPDLALLDRRLGRPTGSDHRPVVTRFTLAEPRSAP